jgi:hypothetical protein
MFASSSQQFFFWLQSAPWRQDNLSDWSAEEQGLLSRMNALMSGDLDPHSLPGMEDVPT